MCATPEGHSLPFAHIPAAEICMESFQCPKCDTARDVARITVKCNFNLQSLSWNLPSLLLIDSIGTYANDYWNVRWLAFLSIYPSI
jgi:hypothetical protein